ncbi:ZIP family metal transporter [Priestia megaterium]|jgi:ZIP family zinc transporter|uniref:ZIP family metal transporter n=1 Tax=Priestia megaterium TaxID=1404 RepID=UPI002866FB71|nr:ZIP family metal transporter [Priestia megaterium]MDR7204675.1 ZIP family zinc transporter [Priestia megaterium]MED3857703.1 ZIP family metal transporter [Priestia megaterium]MED3898715.1 ZIP family metal transporter [Priestia megaterium]
MTEVLIGSILSALSTGVGALPILFLNQELTHRWKDILLALTAGIMTAASTMSLIPESLQSGGFFPLAIGLLLGVVTLTLLEQNIPHIDLEHSKTGIQFDEKALLIVSAITLHNLPEGLLVALFLAQQNINKIKAFLIATLTGSVEIVTSLLGFYLTNFVDSLVSYGLAFAAGAMLFIIYKELIPESHGDGNERFATYSFIFGILFMIFLINIF